MNAETYTSGTTPLAVNPERVIDVKILTALNNGSGGGGGGGSGSVLQGHGAPVAAPTTASQAALYTDLDSGLIYTWNVGSQSWI